MKDQIFSDNQIDPIPKADASLLKSFAFNEQVADVFDDMVRRSVPGYEVSQNIAKNLALRTLKKGDRVYDLGCSTATTLITIAQALRESNPQIQDKVEFCGIDSSLPMIERATRKLKSFGFDQIIGLRNSTLENFSFNSAKLITCLYTLQFLDPKERLLVLKNIKSALGSDGFLVLGEKICFNNEVVQEILTDSYYAFKSANGYSNIEIQRKREALENVLIPSTLEQNIDLLKEVGFTSIEPVFVDLSFATIVAKG